MMHPVSRPIALVMSLVVVASLAVAQPCQRDWDTTIGNPGITSANSYAQPMCPWNDGTGEALYVGGAFSAIGGLGTSNIARWDALTNTWSPLDRGVWRSYTNSFTTSIVPFDPGTGEELFVGGFFDTASGAPGTSHLAKWNGNAWSGLTGGTPDWAVWALAVWNGRLYVGGSFTTAGGVTVNGIASWDGEAWYACGDGMGGPYSPCVFALRVFDDGTGEKLYAAGRFASIGGVSGAIGRWNGTSWEPVGSGLFASGLGGIEAMAVFDDGTGPALYVGGMTFYTPGQPVTSVAEWDGLTWTNVGQNLGGRTTSLAAFDDGTGAALYAGGTAQPATNYFAAREGPVGHDGRWRGGLCLRARDLERPALPGRQLRLGRSCAEAGRRSGGPHGVRPGRHELRRPGHL